MRAGRLRWVWAGCGLALGLAVASVWLDFGTDAAAAGASEAQYVALSPQRILDTRNSTAGAYDTPWGDAQTRPVQVTGVGGVPSTGVESVTLHITTVNATAPISWLTVTPTGDPVSTTAVLNFGTDASGHTLTNDMVIAKVGTGGRIDITNAAGAVDLVIDVVGYHTTTPGETLLQVGLDIEGEAAKDLSGAAVSFNAAGDRVAIGASQNDGGGPVAGHVRIYQWSGTTWSQLGADIDGGGSYDWSGFSVALNATGDRIAIGSFFGAGSSGHVHIFEWNGIAWSQLGADIDGEAGGDRSGSSVALNAAGDRVAIGARDNAGGGTSAGHVRVYEWNGSAWSQLGADIDGEAELDESGSSVALNAAGDRVAIGASQNDGGGDNSGHVRIFQWNGTAWTQLGADIDGEAASDLSGFSVALNAAGDRVAIGALFNDGGGDNAGHVRIFQWNGTAWTQLGADIDGEADLDQSGSSVALNAAGDRVAIGAPENAGGGTSAGHVRVYEWNGSAWSQLGADIDGEADLDGSGSSVALNAAGDRVAIGAPQYSVDTGAGLVRVFDIAPAPTKYNSIETARILDSRNKTQGSYETPWAPGQTRTIQITGVATIPAAATSVVLNVTTVNATAPSSWLTVTPAGEPASNTAVLNYGIDPTVHGITNDMIIAKLSETGAINITNALGNVDIVIDVVGFHAPGASSNFVALPAARILDTRNNIQGAYDTPWEAGQTRPIAVTGVGGVPPTGVKSVVVHLTTVNATAPVSWLTASPTGSSPTNTANVNFGTDPTGHTITNDIVIAEVGTDGNIDITNEHGTVDLVIDIVGYHLS